MRFGKIKGFIIFGGTQRLINFISVARNEGINSIMVISAPRLFKSLLARESITLEDYLKKKRIPYLIADDINSIKLDKFITANILGISFGAPWIFKRGVIEQFKGRLINGHGTNLPKNRGGGGFSWQIMRREKQGCHLFHLVDTGVDTGDIVFSDKFQFPKDCLIPENCQEFFERTEIPFLKKFIKRIKSNAEFKLIKQDERLSTYFPRLSTLHHGFIDWNWQAADIERFICAFDLPYAGASTFLNGKRVFLRRAKGYFKDGCFHPFMRGLIYRKAKGSLFVAVSNGSILIKEAYDNKGRGIFKNLKVGERFVTPIKYLEDALLFRAVYDSKGLNRQRKNNV